jgi:hypothetical protein
MNRNAYKCPFQPNYFRLCRYYEGGEEWQPIKCLWLAKDDTLKCNNNHRNYNIGNISNYYNNENLMWYMKL